MRRARKKKSSGNDNSESVSDYRHDEKRKNVPESGLITYAKEQKQKKQYAYPPHLDPHLDWSGKKEHNSFEVDTVSLHIHERISAQAILKSVQRKGEWVQTTLNIFAEPELSLGERIEFYQHDIDWSNRLILGDSLLVMNSLLERELMAEKVQMMYIDPPYGIAYNSNFQPSIRNRDVKDGHDEDLTREPEQIKAFRDTWELGIHSYLTYLRDRLFLTKDLLNESGSCFVQISDQNLHHVRELLDEVFGSENFIALIAFKKKKMPLGETFIFTMCDYILWYGKNREMTKFRKVFVPREFGEDSDFPYIELDNGKIYTISEYIKEHGQLPKRAKYFQSMDMRSSGRTESCVFEYKFDGKKFYPSGGKSWKTNETGMKELERKNRLFASGDTLRYKLYYDDYPVQELSHMWMDMQGASNKVYVVQTAEKAIQRCILMSTDPGDLVFDPTCGAGTTAYVAEQWGRRWVTCDTSRVAVAIAKQRLMTALYEYYELAHPQEGVRSGFKYKTVPHITLGSITNNEPAQNEILYDQPEVDRSKIRVSGPFTVEAIPAPTIEDPMLEKEHQQVETVMVTTSGQAFGRPSDPGGDHVSDMIELLRKTRTINFPNRKAMALENIRPLGDKNVLHAEADAVNGEKVRVAISIGPRYGPVGVKQLEEAIVAAQWDHKVLILAGFSYDPEVQAFIQKNPHPRLTLQLAHINPDVIVNDLLKTPKGTQIFTVYGQPDIIVKKSKNAEYSVLLKGVDIYDPITGETHQSKAEEVAAWFLDTDYDGYTFRISQVFFPDAATLKNPWDKLQNALRGIIDEDKMERFKGTVSIPFKAGEHKRIAVKVMDYRGNEVVAVRNLDDAE